MFVIAQEVCKNLKLYIYSSKNIINKSMQCNLSRNIFIKKKKAIKYEL